MLRCRRITNPCPPRRDLLTKIARCCIVSLQRVSAPFSAYGFANTIYLPMRIRLLLAFCLVLPCLTGLLAQEDDLLSILGEDEAVNIVKASFKTNRVVNLHSLENTAGGELDVKISHRFGELNGGLYNLFGLDDASTRLGMDYGITDRLQVGIGRSGFNKTYDGYVKMKLLQQTTGAKEMPITAAFFTSIAIYTDNALKPQGTNVEYYFTNRLSYTFQMILGRKFSEGFSLQLSPTLVHRNLVQTADEAHDVLALGVAGRVKLSKRVAINGEYVYVLPGQLAPEYTNSLSIGFDIETGGHVFQLHFTNSKPMYETGYITETSGKWGEGDIYFGFNISRIFTIN